MGEEESYFVEQRRKLAESLERAKHMSSTLDNRLVDQRQGWASWLGAFIAVTRKQVDQAAVLAIYDVAILLRQANNLGL